jgi:uncharacterized membrane protein
MQNALTIHPKVAGSTIAGAIALIVAYVLSLFGIQLPAEVAAALVLVLCAIGGWAASATAATPVTAPIPSESPTKTK